MCDRRRDLGSIASKVGKTFGAVQSILNIILGMSKVLARIRWVPGMLTNDQKRTRLDISRYLLSGYEDDPGDFKQWKHPGSSPPMKLKRVHSAGKVMVSIFLESQGLIMVDYLEQGHTINGAYYAGELRWLRQEISRKGLMVLCSCRSTPLPTCHKLP